MVFVYLLILMRRLGESIEGVRKNVDISRLNKRGHPAGGGIGAHKCAPYNYWEVVCRLKQVVQFVAEIEFIAQGAMRGPNSVFRGTAVDAEE